MKEKLSLNRTPGAILCNCLLALFGLFLNGIGVYLTIHADFGAGPWDVFNLGLSDTFGIKYGTASIIVSFTVLLIDVLLREPIGLTMIIDAIAVGKTVDLLNWLDIVPVPVTWWGKSLMVVTGLFILAFTYALYMTAALGCGPRDTLLVGLKKRMKKVPIGLIMVGIQALVTLGGWLLGGPVYIGTLIVAFGLGPIMQLAYAILHFDPTKITHQNIIASFRVIFRRER